MKRGLEISIFVLVLLVAVFGIWSITDYGKAISMPSNKDTCEMNCKNQFTGEELSACIAGCNIIYPEQSEMTGRTIEFGKTYQINPTFPGDVSPIQSCKESCYKYVPYETQPSCLKRCEQLSSVGDYYYNKPNQYKPTGYFAAPSPKGYGGEIRGVASTGSRAFSGRAYQMPKQSCFKCSCLSQGLSAVNMESAQRVCSENCGGSIIEVTAGACKI